MVIIMSEERFIIEDYGIWDTYKKDEQLSWGELKETLNDLWIENQKLRKGICADDIIKENHQLKQDNMKMREVLEELQFNLETNMRIIKILLGGRQ